MNMHGDFLLSSSLDPFLSFLSFVGWVCLCVCVCVGVERNLMRER
jgi:hypothetical protein